MSCEGENIQEIPIDEVQKHMLYHWERYLHAKYNTAGEPLAIAQSRTIIELKQARLLFAEIVRRPISDIRAHNPPGVEN